MANRYTDKTALSRNEYLQLTGLLAIAAKHYRAIQDIEATIIEITGEREVGGHSADAIFSDYSADQLLEKLDLVVEEDS